MGGDACSRCYTRGLERPNNRALLLQVALTRFASQGYDATGVQEIADAAGVAKPTLYHYFGSKLGLLSTLLEESTAPFLATLAEAAHYDGNLPNTLHRLVSAHLEFAEREPELYRFLLALLFVPTENEAHGPARAVLDQQQRTIEATFSAAANDHGNMRGRHEQYARSLLGVLSAYGLQIVSGDVPNTPALARALVRQFSHGIYS